ncbi:MAG: MATE family efflux transporter [Calditrichia bacterium]|nr:MATE family efflux transporter [Calditrichia bacterium]
MTEITSKRETLVQILKTSLPAAVDLSSQTVTWLIEAILIGHLSTAALAGVGIAQQIILLTFSTLLTFVMGSSIIVARYLGSGDHWNANHILGQSLMVGFFLSIFISLIWYFLAPLIFVVIREEQPIARQFGIQYIRTIAWFAPLVVTNFMALGILRGAGDTVWSMKINIVIQILHLTLAPLLIFGWLGFPRLEAVGAGLAIGIAHSTGFFLTMILLRSRKASLFIAVMEVTRPNFSTFKRLIKIGIPTTVEQMVWAIGQLAISTYAGWLGIVVLATHQVFLRIQGVITMIFFGFGIGSMTLVGKSLGAAHTRQAHRTGMINGAVGFSVAAVIAIFLVLASENIVTIFTNDPSVIALGKSLIYIFALIQLPKGANIVFSGNLRGSADLTWLMWLAISTVCLYEIFGSWLLAIPYGLGLSGLWIVQGFDESTRFILNLWRFNRGKWKEIRL